MTYPVRPNRLAGFPKRLRSRTVDAMDNLGSESATDPIFVEARKRQIQLILQNTLAAARGSIRSATDTVRRRAYTTPDSFTRYHLLEAAREVAAIEGLLEASLWSDETSQPCLVRTVTSEICKLERLYAGRIRPIERRMVVQSFTASWTADIIFRLIVRALIYDAQANVPSNARLSVQLRLVKEMIWLSIDGAGYCTEQTLMLRVDRPKHLKMLLHSLSGSLESRPDGMSVGIPIAACIPPDYIDDAALLWS